MSVLEGCGANGKSGLVNDNQRRMVKAQPLKQNITKKKHFYGPLYVPAALQDANDVEGARRARSGEREDDGGRRG